MKRIIRNAIQCNNCGDIIESQYRHDYVQCKCGKCAVDGGHDYLRRCYVRGGKGFKDLSEVIDRQSNGANEAYPEWTDFFYTEVMAMLLRRKAEAHGEWIFYKFVNPCEPTNPAAAYRKLKVILKNAGLPLIRFHDLRHTFATMARENGMDVKTLSATIGHVSAATTLDIYSHMTDTMQTHRCPR